MHTTSSRPLITDEQSPAAEFWLKTDTYLEQPEVTYTKELLLLAEGFKGGEPFSASFSTLGVINLLNHAGLRAAVVKVIAPINNLFPPRFRESTCRSGVYHRS